MWFCTNHLYNKDSFYLYIRQENRKKQQKNRKIEPRLVVQERNLTYENSYKGVRGIKKPKWADGGQPRDLHQWKVTPSPKAVSERKLQELEPLGHTATARGTT